MKIKTFYISEDNIHFTDLNDCVDYENEFYNALKKAEQDNLGERLQHKMFEPCLETKKAFFRQHLENGKHSLCMSFKQNKRRTKR